eukprot:1625864-Rhodomonas_salina.3
MEYKKSQIQSKLYQQCGFLYLISGCMTSEDLGEGDADFDVRGEEACNPQRLPLLSVAAACTRPTSEVSRPLQTCNRNATTRPV